MKAGAVPDFGREVRSGVYEQSAGGGWVTKSQKFIIIFCELYHNNVLGKKAKQYFVNIITDGGLHSDKNREMGSSKSNEPLGSANVNDVHLERGNAAQRLECAVVMPSFCLSLSLSIVYTASNHDSRTQYPAFSS